MLVQSPVTDTVILMESQAKTSRAVVKRIESLKIPAESWNDFAKRIGVSAQTVSNWRGGNAPSLDSILVLLERTKVSAAWLLLGVGTKESAGPEDAEVRMELARLAIIGDTEDVIAALQIREPVEGESDPAKETPRQKTARAKKEVGSSRAARKVPGGKKKKSGGGGKGR